MSFYVSKKKDYKEIFKNLKLDGTEEWEYTTYCNLINKIINHATDYTELIKDFENRIEKFNYEEEELQKTLVHIEWLKDEKEYSEKIIEYLKNEDIKKYNRALETIESLNNSNDELAWDYFMGWQSPISFNNDWD